MSYTADPKDPHAEARRRNAAQQRKRYSRLTADKKAAIVARNERRRQANLYLVHAYLSVHPCVDCGETDTRVLEFDHVSGEKRKAISALVQYSRKAVLAEILKCEVVCANCHKRRTWKQLGYRDYRPVSGPRRGG